MPQTIRIAKNQMQDHEQVASIVKAALGTKMLSVTTLSKYFPGESLEEFEIQVVVDAAVPQAMLNRLQTVLEGL